MQHSAPWVQTPYPFQFCNEKKACVVMIETTYPVKIFAVCLLRLFHPITPSVSSMCPAPTCCIFLFSNFLWWFRELGMLLWDCYYILWTTKPIEFPLIIRYLYMSCDASTKTIYVFWKLWSMDYKLLEKHTFIFLFNAHIFIHNRCRTRESL